MGNPNCCFMIIAVAFFFSSQSPRGTVIYAKGSSIKDATTKKGVGEGVKICLWIAWGKVVSETKKKLQTSFMDGPKGLRPSTWIHPAGPEVLRHL